MPIYSDSMTRHIGLFQIHFLRSCPLLIDRKMSLISLARYMISGQSDTGRLGLLPDMVSLGFGFKLIIVL